MSYLKTIAAGAAIAGSMGFAALGIGTAVANAAPSPAASQAGWAEYHGWGHGPGWGPGYWAPPPPPPPPYGYGGYGDGYGFPPPCATGPLGLVHVCA